MRAFDVTCVYTRGQHMLQACRSCMRGWGTNAPDDGGTQLGAWASKGGNRFYLQRLEDVIDPHHVHAKRRRTHHHIA